MLVHVDGTTDGEVAQKTVGPSKYDVNTLTVHLLGSNVFFLLVILLHKRRFSSNSIILSGMAFPVVEFSRQGYKIRKVFG